MALLAGQEPARRLTQLHIGLVDGGNEVADGVGHAIHVGASLRMVA